MYLIPTLRMLVDRAHNLIKRTSDFLRAFPIYITSSI